MQDIDLNAALNAGAYHPEGTAMSYSTYFNKFAVFVGAERYNHKDMNTMVPKQYFNIDSLAKFFYDLGKTNDYKPHLKKAALAAINVGIQHHHLENIYNFKHLYPNTHLILKQWECHLKVTPYFVQKGERFDTSAVSMIIAMTALNDMELRDLLATVVIIFTGLRANSLYIAQTKDWTKCPSDHSTPRHWRLSLPRTKTDSKGTGPMLPCICLTDMDIKDKTKFLKELKKDPFCRCTNSCPFSIMCDYMNKCPQTCDTTAVE